MILNITGYLMRSHTEVLKEHPNPLFTGSAPAPDRCLIVQLWLYKQ